MPMTDTRSGSSEDTELDTPLWAFPARVTDVLDRSGKTGDGLLAAATEMAPDASVFDENPPAFWRAEISSTREDSYSTRMDPETTLMNFERDMNDGTPFMESHNTGGLFRGNGMLPIGRSLEGKIQGSNRGQKSKAVIGTFYTLTNLEIRNGTYGSTDGWLKAMRGGLVPDVSVGFIPGWWRCSLDGEDLMWSDKCRHIPGLYYKGDDIVKPGTPGAKKALADVVDARLAEVSSVYSGATPGAGIIRQKAEREVQAARLEAPVARMLETTYRMKLRGADQLYLPAEVRTEEEFRDDGGGVTDCPIEPTTEPEAQAEETESDDREEIVTVPATRDPEPETSDPAEEENTPEDESTTELSIDAHAEGYRSLAPDELARLGFVRDGVPFEDREIVDEVLRLRELAQIGERWRTDLIDGAIQQGIRAFAAKERSFDEAKWRGTLAKLSVDEIREFQSEWQADGDALLTGGRKTVDSPRNEKPGEAPSANGKPPASAFRTRQGGK